MDFYRVLPIFSKFSFFTISPWPRRLLPKVNFLLSKSSNGIYRVDIQTYRVFCRVVQRIGVVSGFCRVLGDYFAMLTSLVFFFRSAFLFRTFAILLGATEYLFDFTEFDARPGNACARRGNRLPLDNGGRDRRISASPSRSIQQPPIKPSKTQ